MEEVYDSILEVRIDNTRTRNKIQEHPDEGFSLQPMELFQSFYQEMQGQPMSPEEEALLHVILDEWRGDEM